MPMLTNEGILNNDYVAMRKRVCLEKGMFGKECVWKRGKRMFGKEGVWKRACLEKSVFRKEHNMWCLDSLGHL